MADPIGVLGGVAAAVADVQKTLGSLKAIEDQLNKARSVVCTILNVTDQTLIFAGAHQDHGGFATNPPPTIAPRSAAAFGAQSSAGAIATGAEGTVNYGLPGGTLHFHWDDPFAGGNSASAALDGDQGRFATWSNAGAGDQNAQMQFVVFERTFQNDWRFCDKCNGMFFDGFASKGVCPGGPLPGTTRRVSFSVCSTTRRPSGPLRPIGGSATSVMACSSTVSSQRARALKAEATTRPVSISSSRTIRRAHPNSRTGASATSVPGCSSTGSLRRANARKVVNMRRRASYSPSTTTEHPVERGRGPFDGRNGSIAIAVDLATTALAAQALAQAASWKS